MPPLSIVKVDRFGFVKRAMHGTKMLNAKETRDAYGRELVRLANSDRWKFINTFFSVSEAVMFSQLVDRLDEGEVPDFVLKEGRSYKARLRVKDNRGGEAGRV